MNRYIGILMKVITVIATFLLLLLFTWLTLPEYNKKISLSSDVQDTTGKVLLHTSEWLISKIDNPSINRIICDIIIGDHGIQRGGGIKLSLGHVINMDHQKRIYTPFSLTIPSALFFRTDLLKDVNVQGTSHSVTLQIDDPSPARAFLDVIRYIKYKRSKAGRTNPDNLLRQIDNEYSVTLNVTRGSLAPGDTVRLTLGHKNGLQAPPRETSWQLIVRIDGDGDGHYGLINSLPTLEVYSDQVARVDLIAPGTMKQGDTDTMLCRVSDDYFLPNLSHFGEGLLVLNSQKGLEYEDSLHFSGIKGGLLKIPFSALESGIFRVHGNVRIDGHEYPVCSNPLWVSEYAPSQIFFGDIHSHSIISYDADRPPDYVYWRHRHLELFDFAAVSDHDMIGAIPLADRNSVQGRTPEEWAYLKQLGNRWNKPGIFVTLLAYEWTSYSQGHRNIYFHPDVHDPPLIPHNRDDHTHPHHLKERLQKYHDQYLAIPHSTAWSTAEVVYNWGPKMWNEQRQVEIYSTHGASEYFDNPYAVDKGHSEIPTESPFIKDLMNYNITQAPEESGNFVRDALAEGFRFGFLASSDMHYLSYLNQAYPPGIMAVFADTLTRKSLWNGICQRRTFATTGSRILLDFHINKYPMGSIIVADENTSIHLQGKISGTDILENVTIVKYDGHQFSDWFVEHIDQHLDYSFALSDSDWHAGSIYYLRIRQKNGQMAWSSPIWIVNEHDEHSILIDENKDI